MSETETAPPKRDEPPASIVIQPTQEQPGLVSPSPANQSTAAASSASAGAVVVILIWALSEAKLTVPAEVAASFTVLISAVVHWALIKYGLKTE